MCARGMGRQGEWKTGPGTAGPLPTREVHEVFPGLVVAKSMSRTCGLILYGALLLSWLCELFLVSEMGVCVVL